MLERDRRVPRRDLEDRFMTTDPSIPLLAATAPEVLAGLMSRAGVAVAVLDGCGTLSVLSPAMQQLLHRPFERIPSGAIAQHFHLYTEDGARLLRPHEVPLVRAWRGEVVEGATVMVRAPGQPVRHLRVEAAPVASQAAGRPEAWAIATDVTSRVASARGELSRSLAETVNHDLRTPLTTILGHAELLLDRRDELSPAAARSVEAVARAGHRLDEVVTSISAWIDVAYSVADADRRSHLARFLQRRRPS